MHLLDKIKDLTEIHGFHNQGVCLDPYLVFFGNVQECGKGILCSYCYSF